MYIRATSFIAAIALVLATACGNPDEAQQVVDRSLETHAMEVLDRAEVGFTFRGDEYRMVRYDGDFRYERVYGDTTDVLANDGASRFVRGQPVALTADEEYALETAVNSVVYFAFLPYRLNDPAARKAHLGQEDIRGERFDVVEVTFDEEDGGRDHDDRFVYWINAESATLDYLAYYYHTNEGGSRFRMADNRRNVSGTLVQDYRNYAPRDDTLSPGQIEMYPQLLDGPGLDHVSDIRLEDVVIRHLPERPDFSGGEDA